MFIHYVPRLSVFNVNYRLFGAVMPNVYTPMFSPC